MVVHRTCSFCAGDIEPGTGQLFVKRDGSLFAFCSSSCRKQQLGLGRVGHRLRWTHAHELKRQAEQRRQPTTPETTATPSPKPSGAKPKEQAPAAADAGTGKKTSKPKPPEAASEPKSAETKAAAKKPRPKKAAPNPPTP